MRQNTYRTCLLCWREEKDLPGTLTIGSSTAQMTLILFFPHIPSFHPEYGVMFNNLGQLVPGVKKTFLFVLVDIPETDSLKSMEF